MRKFVVLIVVISMLFSGVLVGFSESFDPDNISILGKSISDSITISTDSLDEIWIQQHYNFVGSDEYSESVTGTFSGLLWETYTSARDDTASGMYEALDVFNKIYGLRLDELTSDDEYEILIAEVLFCASGQKSTQQVFMDELQNSVFAFIKAIKDTAEEAEKGGELLVALADKSVEGLFSESVKEFFDSSEVFRQELLDKALLEKFAKISSYSFEVEAMWNYFNAKEKSLEEVCLYLAIADAYCKTNSMMKEQISALRSHIFVETDTFSPLTLENMLTQEEADEIVGYYRFSPNITRRLSVHTLANVLDKMYHALDIAEKDGIVVLQHELEQQTSPLLDEKILQSVAKTGVSCLIKAFPLISKIVLVTGTIQAAIDLFTQIDERAVHEKMILWLAVLQKIQYYALQDLQTILTAEDTEQFIILDDEYSNHTTYLKTKVFDAEFGMYRSICSIACQYASGYWHTFDDPLASKIPDNIEAYTPFSSQQSEIDKKSATLLAESNQLKTALPCHSEWLESFINSKNQHTASGGNVPAEGQRPEDTLWQYSSKDKNLPSSIVLYANGSKSEEYFFSYNSSHQVIGLECYRYENGEATKWFSQKYEYDENGNPTLIEHTFSQGTQKYQYVYDYNSSGQITGYSYAEYYRDALGPTDYYTFSYDGDCVSERHNKDGSSIEKFSYDESKNIVYETAEFEHGDGHFDESTTFDFTYAPFVIYTHTSESKEYGNSSGKSIVFMPHWNLSPASCGIDNSCSLHVNASGDLVRVTNANGDNICTINYQESTSSPIGLYLPKVQRAREQSMSAEDVDEKNVNAQTYGILMDWDDDGLQELFISYVQPERWYGIRKIGVYDIQGGQLITLIEDLDTTFAEAAAGMHDFAGVTMYKGIPAVFAWYRIANTSMSPWEVYYGARTYFTLWSINSQSVLHKAEITCDGNNLSYVIDSVACTEADFYSLIGDCTFLSYDSAPPTAHLSYTIETLKVDDLINILQKDSLASGTIESTYELSDASEGDDNLKAEVQTQPHFPEGEDTSTETETTPSNFEFQNEPTTPVQSISGCIANADNGLNVRQEPGTSAKIIRRIYNGEWVTITEQTTIGGMPWGRISDGWICMNYVKTEDASSKSQEYGKQYIVAPSAGSLNVRCGPGTSYQSVERIDGGEKVLIYEEKSVDGRKWGRTDIGWVCMDYLISSP